MEQKTISELLDSFENPKHRSSRRRGQFWAYPEPEVITWSEAIKKEARGLDGLDLGEVQEVVQDYVRVVRGILKREEFFIPRELVHGFDGGTLWFTIRSAIELRYMRPILATRAMRARHSRV